ncbi:MAG: hypothetical protein QOI54_129 [Actinomycetota bacterium]|nr:hypothetical protein [Actinomycetota bacterium]
MSGRAVSRRTRVAVAVGAGLALASGGVAGAATGLDRQLGERVVGRQADGSVLTSQNQFVTPAGDTIEQTGRPMAMAVRPDGRSAVTLTRSGKGLFTVVDLVARAVLQQYTPPKGVGSNSVGRGGLLWSPDGRTLWAAQTKNLLRFTVGPDGTLADPVAIPLAGVEGRQALPTSLAWAPDGRHILVVLNGNNTLGVLDPVAGRLTGEITVGNAPSSVAVVGDAAFVSNEGGRPATEGDVTNLSYGTPIVADHRDGAASTGTVSEVDVAAGREVRSYQVGLEPTALLPVGADLLVTNVNDDSVSVIDTAAHQVGQTFSVNPLPGAPAGVSPTALAMLDPTHLLVALGRDNALAVYSYRGARRTPSFEGLIPTGWYPGDVSYDATLRRIVVANQQGVGALGAPRTIDQGPGTTPATGHQVYADIGTVQLTPAPTGKTMRTWTEQVFANNRWNGLASHNRRGGHHEDEPASAAVPRRIGDRSPIRHVFLIVRENRTYDQVLGDDARGNGEPSYAQFGAAVTPNAHALARDFPLIDNLYADGTNSAEGHNWLDGAFMSDYLARNYANYVRSYQTGDALMYPRAGYIWDNAVAHGVRTQVWGENANGFAAADGSPPQGSWSAWYRDSRILEGKETGDLHAPVGFYRTTSDMPSLNALLQPDYPNFNLAIPDQYRADLFLRDLAHYEQSGDLPALNILWVMTDHTSGTAAGLPTPRAAVADNDLATGRIVDGISHSRFWKDSAVFVIEDDSQNGIDHLDGHRTVAMVASPYARRGAVVHTYYSQLNVTRTIEQILGLPPMNRMDLAAEPMYDVFTDTPDRRPYDVRPSQLALDELNRAPATLTPGPEHDWARWSQGQDWSSEDDVNMEQSNRLIWYTSSGFTEPYPGDDRVLTPAEVARLHPQSGRPDGD